MLKSKTRKQESQSRQCEDKEQGTILSGSLQLFDELDVPTQTFYVFFSGQGSYPGKGLIKKGFRHVGIMQQIPLGYIVHEPTFYALDTYILPEAPIDLMVERLRVRRPDYTVIEVVRELSNRDRKIVRFGLHTCVQTVAYIMGVCLPWYTLTPYALYKYLLKGRPEFIRVRRI